MIYLVLPILMQVLGYASITLDDGHQIRSPFIRSGQTAPVSGFIVSVGDMADIQAGLHGNSCLIRVSEIKARFELETVSRVDRCNKRLGVFQKSLDESKLLNKNLSKDLKEERTYSERLLLGSILATVALSATSVYFATK